MLIDKQRGTNFHAQQCMYYLELSFHGKGWHNSETRAIAQFITVLINLVVIVTVKSFTVLFLYFSSRKTGSTAYQKSLKFLYA